MARKKEHQRILPFRIPFFRIFYSTTYTTLFLLCLGILGITPATLLWTAVESAAYQYIIMVGGVYILTGTLTIFIYSSRLYTNRSVLAGVGKAYIPIEPGEVVKSVRKMIVKQLERSAIVAWEARPRDLVGEILQAEKLGVLPPETMSAGHNDYTVGRIISVDPASPPWGNVKHAGWSSPSHVDDKKYPNVQFASVIQELPNLVEARAVSLAPADLSLSDEDHEMADPTVVDLLRRAGTMGMRDYLTQLSYLRLIRSPEIVEIFLRQYEYARFCGRPVTEAEFSDLMSTFSELLADMTELEPEFVEQIRTQARERASEDAEEMSPPASDYETYRSMERPSSSSTSSRTTSRSPVTARTRPSRTTTPYLQADRPSVESFSSVVRRTPMESARHPDAGANHASLDGASTSSLSLPSDAGSVIHHANSEDVG